MTDDAKRDDSPPPARYGREISLFLLIVLLAGCLLVMQAFFSALLWATVLSFSLWPGYRWLVGRLGGRRSLAALLITLTIAATLVAPLIVTVANLSDDAHAIAVAGRAWFDSGFPAPPAWIRRLPLVGPSAARGWEDLASDLDDLASQLRTQNRTTPASTEPASIQATETEPASTQPASTQPVDSSKLLQAARTIIAAARNWILVFGLAIGQGVMQIVLSLFLMFFILRDGAALAKRLRDMMRHLSGENGVRLLEVAGGTVRGVTYGILGTAVTQGLMAGIGFLIAGVPGATLLGLLTFFLSVVPMGPPLVWIPATIWLFHQGTTGWGIFMLIWGVAVSSIDNVIKPWLISRGSKMPFLLIFFGVLGGALSFGLIGVFIGPTLLAVAFRLVSEWGGDPNPDPTKRPVA